MLTSEPRYTDGPWEFVPPEYLSHDAPGVEVVVSKGGILGDTKGFDPHWIIEGAEHIRHANGHLIAAAPELYEACEAALEFLRRAGLQVMPEYPVETMLRDALAKARGEVA